MPGRCPDRTGDAEGLLGATGMSSSKSPGFLSVGNAATGSASVRSAVNGKPESDMLLFMGAVVFRHSGLATALATPSEMALNGPSRVHDHVADRTERHRHARQGPPRSVITTMWTCQRLGRRVHGNPDPDPAVHRFTDDVRRRQTPLQTCRACTAEAEGLPGRHSAGAQWRERHRYPHADVEPRVRDTTWHLIAAGA